MSKQTLKPQYEGDKPPNNTSVCKLEIIVRDKDGKVIQTKYVDNDMYLDQWQAIIAALFKNLGNGTYSGSTTFSCKNSAGTAVTLGGVASTGNSPFFAIALEGLAGQLKVAIGTGTIAAVHTDYWLQTPYAQGYPSSITVSNPSGSIVNVSFSVTISLATGATISEAVVQLIALDSAGTQRGLAITHDVFTGIPVPSSGSITLNYTFQFNTS